MNSARLLLGLVLGRRLPVTRGRLRVAGPAGPVVVRRDRYGIPSIEAENDADAWFGLGFCHGQDRSFQLEFYVRAVRGTLAELLGRRALGADRLARRVGFRRAGVEHLRHVAADLRADMEAYVRGVEAGRTRGSRGRPHELALLFGRPTTWDAADVLGFLKLQSFVTPSNWDVELARYEILRLDGPEALAALDPAGAPTALDAVRAAGLGAGPAAGRLAEDVAALSALVPPAAASNNWALAGSRTATGRPILANDPHLPSTCPSVWYLARVATPRWAVAGASMVGGPCVPIGHNGRVAWGATAGLVDTTDLFVEEIGPDGASVRRGDRFVPCTVRRERIGVRGGRAVIEEVLETPHGPVIGPALSGEFGALALRATWLRTEPLRGLLRAHLAPDAAAFRRLLADWPALTENVVFADVSGTIGYQMMGHAPRRRKGWGLLPADARDPSAGWDEGPVPFEQMPHAFDPPEGFLATANNRPAGDGPFLSADWLDPYRVNRIATVLAGRRDWTPADVQGVQQDRQSVPWEEMKASVLAAPDDDPAARQALDLLRTWDERVTAESSAAAVFELFVAEMAVRVARAKAPRGWRWALGGGFSLLMPHNLFAARRVGHLVRLLVAQPAGWFERPWPAEVADALAAAVRTLQRTHGPSPAGWAWGRVRTLTFRHPLGDIPWLGRAFNSGPMPCGGDTNTVAQASVDALAPTANAHIVAALRAVMAVGDWDASRFGLAGGQSGNPLSPHYDDLLPLWQRGEGVPITFAPAEVGRATRRTLRLLPAAGPSF